MTATQDRTSTPELRSFNYEAVGKNGQVSEGRLLSTSESEAVARIRRLGLRPVQVELARTSRLSGEVNIRGLGDRISPAEIAILSRQFSTMVGAGVPLLRSLSVLLEQTENVHLTNVLQQVRTDIESGDSLSESLARHPKVFDKLYIPMVKAGETAGALDVVLGQLATTLERSVALRNKVKSAMTYPIAVLCLVVVVIAAMLLFVVPVFADIYDDLGGGLPLPTRTLVAISVALTTKLPLTAFAIGATTYVTRFWLGSDRGRLQWDRIKLRLPLIGDMIHKTAIARLTRVLAVLSRSGVPILDALTIAGETVGNAAIQQAVLETRQEVRRGGSMGRKMSEDPLFPPMVIQLVAIGEETGTLDEMLETVADAFEQEVEASVDGFAALIEPLLMAFIGFVVGGMVIALYLPMFRLVDLVQ